MISDYHNNFMIYISNLSLYYVTCVLIAVIAIIVSWYFHFKNVILIDTNVDDKSTDSPEEHDLFGEIGDENLTDSFPKYKTNTKETLEKITATMTKEQLQAEKEAEMRQLESIYELLKKQQDKLNLGSMEELEGQLKLYR